MLARYLSSADREDASGADERFYIQIGPKTDLDKLHESFSWILEGSSRLVVKPDMLLKRRGKANLVLLNVDWETAKTWLKERRGTVLDAQGVSDTLDYFLVERFIAHQASDEYYLCLQSLRLGDEILFFHEGGVDVGDVDSKATRMFIPIEQGSVSAKSVCESLLSKVPENRRSDLSEFISKFYSFFVSHHFTYLEVNPIVVLERDNGSIDILALDMAAKIDEAAHHECRKLWGDLEFPAPFGHTSTKEEAFIQELDSRTGSSLKLTLLNPDGRIWLMVAGGGASVIYADTVCDYGMSKELANYGEYSGAPSESLTYNYACTILDLMTRGEPNPEGKLLFIGGGIANFTNVADTFKGIVRAIGDKQAKLRQHNVQIYVRRGGPNYQEGLERMKSAGSLFGLDIEVYGPETHLTSIVAMALGKPVASLDFSRGNADEKPSSVSVTPLRRNSSSPSDVLIPMEEYMKRLDLAEQEMGSGEMVSNLYSRDTEAIVYGLQVKAVQNMLDFDFVCGKKTPSVVAIVYTFSIGNSFHKFYWGSQEVLLPVYSSLDLCFTKHPKVTVVVNFASMRSVYSSTLDILKYAPTEENPGSPARISTIALIAEGVPERRTRQLIHLASQKNVTIIGPATVGGIKPGCFRIGNTAGMLDNVISSKLFRPGSVAYVSRSGGLSNELNNIIARSTDGVYEGVAIGGDRYPISTFMDHLLRYETNPKIKMLVLLGEVGGTLEYDVCEAIKDGRLTKPIVAWCTGTCAKAFSYEVQFGHAGAVAQDKAETADAKNSALKSAGALVPENFEEFAILIHETFNSLVKSKAIIPVPEVIPPSIPVDYAWARKLGLIRKPSSFISSISDERGEELEYSGMKISSIFEEDLGIGGIIGLLWFKKRLPDYGAKFIETVLMVTADHGPAVSGAHNAIVTARAGKDLVSSLCSGLLTIGPRFGGALDESAKLFAQAYDSGVSAEEFVSDMRKQKKLIMGIGHKVKSLENPDVRVVIIKNFVKDNFKSSNVLDFALEVEQVTTKKKSNLILNVDGAIAAAFVDLLRSCGLFSKEEVEEYIEMGVLNGLFVLGRSIGFIGHFLDQKRLKQGLYRHDTDDISYVSSFNQ